MVTRAAGFSLIEMIVALSLTLAATAGVFALMIPAHGAFAAQAEASDMQQRLRVVTDTLVRDLGRAGTGAYAGAGGGPLRDRAPVMPYRAGVAGGGQSYASDRATISWNPASGQPARVSYWLKNDAAADPPQLMLTDESGADVPVIDHVVGLLFEYSFGDPEPPLMRTPLTNPVGPWTTYGPAPSAAVVAPFAAGENCVFVNDGSPLPQPRLAALGPRGGALVPLTAAQLTDGPWCPDDEAPNRWDADLLRVRRVAVTIRLQAAVTALRGPAGPLFVRGGTSRGGAAWVPDIEARFDVTPRNLNLRR